MGSFSKATEKVAAHAYPLCFSFFPVESLSRVLDARGTWLTSAHQGSRHSRILVVARAWGRGRSWGPQVPLITDTGGCGSAETSGHVRPGLGWGEGVPRGESPNGSPVHLQALRTAPAPDTSHCRCLAFPGSSWPCWCRRARPAASASHGAGLPHLQRAGARPTCQSGAGASDSRGKALPC